MRVVLPIIFAMMPSAVVAAPDPARVPIARPAPAGESELICKNEPVTGTRAKVRRLCGTREQWDRRAKSFPRKFYDRYYGSNGV